jgi:hypothetical protein
MGLGADRAIMSDIHVGMLFAIAMLLAGCSSPALPDRYAHCEDLGTLRLSSTSIDDAEERMRAQVEILGGDMLLFSARGHTEEFGAVPSALVQRRNVLGARPAESINGRQPELEALTASVAARETQEELWYYGAALRCKRPASAQ